MIQFVPEADLLWQMFLNCSEYRIDAELDYESPPAQQLLARALRSSLLESRIVTPEGQPLLRPSERLRWELAPANGDDDDYRLRLVQADGTPAPPLLTVLPGSPALYLSRTAVFKGPLAAPNLLETTSENHIPAQALENNEGVAFLRSLGLELPPALRERVRTIDYQAAIICELRASLAAGGSEECVVDVRAGALDGHEMRLKSAGWVQTKPRKAGPKAKDRGEIIVYDRAILAQVQSLLEPLKLKSTYRDDLSLRVTRKFPETFAAWLKTIPPQVTVQLKGELASFAGAEVAGRVKLDVTEAEIDWFDLRVGLDVADTTLTPAETKLLLNARGA
ncbi:MAG: hypothetical protein ACREIC_03900, partial [Limisphaerales bacterium]